MNRDADSFYVLYEREVPKQSLPQIPIGSINYCGRFTLLAFGAIGATALSSTSPTEPVIPVAVNAWRALNCIDILASVPGANRKKCEELAGSMRRRLTQAILQPSLHAIIQTCFNIKPLSTISLNNSRIGIFVSDDFTSGGATSRAYMLREHN